jgi:hypothetical protein
MGLILAPFQGAEFLMTLSQGIVLAHEALGCILAAR